MMNRLILSLLLLWVATGIARAEPKPNILFILTDDQGWPTLGSYGNKMVPTPHLDRLAAEGMRFTDAYVMPQCTPTRAAFLTGQHTARNGMWHVISWYGAPWGSGERACFCRVTAARRFHGGERAEGGGLRDNVNREMAPDGFEQRELRGARCQGGALSWIRRGSGTAELEIPPGRRQGGRLVDRAGSRFHRTKKGCALVRLPRPSHHSWTGGGSRGDRAKISRSGSAHLLDVVLSNLPVQRDAETPLQSHLLDEQPVSLVGRKGCSRKAFRFPDDLRDTPLLLPGHDSNLRAAFDLLMEGLGIRPVIAAEVDDMAMLRLLAFEGAGLALVPPVVVRQELENGLLVERHRIPEIRETFYAVTLTRHYPDPPFPEPAPSRIAPALRSEEGGVIRKVGADYPDLTLATGTPMP